MVDHKDYKDLSIEEQKIILELEIKKIEHEIAISNLVFDLHEEDTYEDLFRDNVPLLKEKIDGIKIALKKLYEQ